MPTILTIDMEQIHAQVRLLEDLQVDYAPDSDFNGKLLVWFHPHRGGKSAQRWLKQRLKKSFPRADFFMPRYLGKFDGPIIAELATELLLLTAALHEDAKCSSRPYAEVVIVAYGEGVLVVRKMLDFSSSHLPNSKYSAFNQLIDDGWNEISTKCRTVFIARGASNDTLREIGHEGETLKPWWRNLANRFVDMVTR